MAVVSISTRYSSGITLGGLCATAVGSGTRRHKGKSIMESRKTRQTRRTRRVVQERVAGDVRRGESGGAREPEEERCLDRIRSVL